MYNQNAHNAYKQNTLNITSPNKLVEMMYEGILKFLAQAKKYLEEEDIEKQVYWINRAIAIFSELISVLDYNKGGEVAHYLSGLYNYQIKALSESITLHGDKKQEGIDRINGAIHVSKELLEAWKETSNQK
jgi:flagellar protein FliS